MIAQGLLPIAIDWVAHAIGEINQKINLQKNSDQSDSRLETGPKALPQ